MKSKIIEGETGKFPIIAKSKGSKLTILFSAERTGTVLIATNASDPVGSYKEIWISVFDSYQWQILNSVTITFEA